MKTTWLYKHLRSYCFFLFVWGKSIWLPESSNCLTEASSKSATELRNEILIFGGPCSNWQNTSKLEFQKCLPGCWSLMVMLCYGWSTTSSVHWMHLCWFVFLVDSTLDINHIFKTLPHYLLLGQCIYLLPQNTHRHIFWQKKLNC